MNINEGAGIKCSTCGARPFAAEWGLPPELESFDLRKIDDLWFCASHRKRTKAKDKTAMEAPADKKKARESDAERIQRIFDELAARIDDDETDDLVAQGRAALERLA
jgi:hypothetical protein